MPYFLVDLNERLFVFRDIRGKNRSLNATWLMNHHWMRYSVSRDAVFCAPCVLFGSRDSKEKTFVLESPQSDWANIGRDVKRHTQQTSNHHKNVQSAEEFIRIREGEKPDICMSMSQAYNDTVAKNRCILECIIDALIVCGKQNIAIRGHGKDDGNFQALLQMRAKDNELLADHLKHCDPRAKYTSPEIQNELVDIIGSQIREPLIQDCNNAPFFAFIADEATDCSTREQVSICVRYLDRSGDVQEQFLEFVEAKRTTGEALAQLFLSSLEDLGINIEKMRAQGYDGAANMSGKHRGVQARVRQIVPQATYVHCKAHSLNLAIVHACREPLVRNIMDTVQQISFCFNESGKRMVAFRYELVQDDEVKADMGRRAKLQTLCDTRWASRSDALFTFLSAYPVVVSSLEELETQGDSRARSFICSISKFDFLVTLVVVENILQIVHPLSIMLQAKTFDLIEAVAEAKVVVHHLDTKRNDDTEWDTLFDKATDLADKVDKVPVIPRGAARQQHRANVPAATPKEYWKRALYYPFIDHMMQELQDRLVGNEDRFRAEQFIPTKLHGLTDAITRQVYDTYVDDLPADNFGVFHTEVGRWKTRWSIAINPRPGTLGETIKATSPHLYPNIYVCLAVLVTMPVATATAERSFSVMRRVKTYLRSTMTTERLSSLALMHAYKDVTIDVQQVINVFADRKQRRLAFLFRE